VVVGASDTATGGTHGALWFWAENGPTVVDLGTLGGPTSQALAINGYGLVVGSADTAIGTDAFLYEFGKMFDLGNLGGSFASANAINAGAVVVGTSNTTGDGDTHAFIWNWRRGLRDLNSLIPANSGWDLQTANSINDDGTIVGTGVFNDPMNGAESHAFVLTRREE
jgi:probable HAF family extracellular repeat protein